MIERSKLYNKKKFLHNKKQKLESEISRKSQVQKKHNLSVSKGKNDKYQKWRGGRHQPLKHHQNNYPLLRFK